MICSAWGFPTNSSNFFDPEITQKLYAIARNVRWQLFSYKVYEALVLL